MNARQTPPLPTSLATSEGEAALMLEALRLLEGDPQLSQRQLSRALGLSVGKTHYVLHALLGKGLVKVQNFRRSDNKMAYAYLLTPEGVREKLAMTREFLARKEAEYVRLQSTIEQLRREIQAARPSGAAR